MPGDECGRRKAERTHGDKATRVRAKLQQGRHGRRSYKAARQGRPSYSRAARQGRDARLRERQQLVFQEVLTGNVRSELASFPEGGSQNRALREDDVRGAGGATAKAHKLRGRDCLQEVFPTHLAVGTRGIRCRARQ